MKIDLSGKTAVITGASRGLGAGMAQMLSDAGAHIALVARDAARLETVKASLPGSADIFPADVTSEADVARIAEGIGAADILINCAGTNLRKAVTDFTLAEFEGVVASSLRGSFLMCRALVGGMRERRHGRILNIASIFGHVSLPHRTAYSSGKAALLGFTKSLALEVAPDGVTVNSISPGPVLTDMNRVLVNDPVASKFFNDNLPVGRWGTIEEVASLACYLASDSAGFITGTDVIIDGGWTAK